MPVGVTRTCTHQLWIMSNNVLASEMVCTLGIKFPPRSESTPEDGWCCILASKREKGSTALWLVLYNGIPSPLRASSISVTESLSARRINTSYSRRVRCHYCTRSPSNRTTCPHEKAVIKCAQEIDGGPEVDSNTNEGGRRSQFGYESVLPRRFMPCTSDTGAIFTLLGGIMATACEDESIEMDRVLKPHYEAVDIVRKCKQCGYVMFGHGGRRNCRFQTRQVTCHTLLHGSVLIIVVDLQYQCGLWYRFDGRDNGIISSGMKHVLQETSSMYGCMLLLCADPHSDRHTK